MNNSSTNTTLKESKQNWTVMWIIPSADDDSYTGTSVVYTDSEDNAKKAVSKKHPNARFVRIMKGNFGGDFSETLFEDTVKTKSGKWVNKGKEGTHGEFKTKKAADAQRRAMFANAGKNPSFGECIETPLNEALKDTLVNKDYEYVSVYLTSKNYKEDKDNRQSRDGVDIFTWWRGKNNLVTVYVKNGKVVEIVGRLTESLNSVNTLSTPRGTFEIYDGSWEDFKNDPKYEGWGMWFEHLLPDGATWKDTTDYYKIMSNGREAVAVLYMHKTPNYNESILEEDFDDIEDVEEGEFVLNRYSGGYEYVVTKKNNKYILKKHDGISEPEVISERETMDAIYSDLEDIYEKNADYDLNL